MYFQIDLIFSQCSKHQNMIIFRKEAEDKISFVAVYFESGVYMTLRPIQLYNLEEREKLIFTDLLLE